MHLQPGGGLVCRGGAVLLTRGPRALPSPHPTPGLRCPWETPALPADIHPSCSRTGGHLDPTGAQSTRSLSAEGMEKGGRETRGGSAGVGLCSGTRLSPQAAEA